MMNEWTSYLPAESGSFKAKTKYIIDISAIRVGDIYLVTLSTNKCTQKIGN